MKLLDYMSVHPRLGPYITMAGKMVGKACELLLLAKLAPTLFSDLEHVVHNSNACGIVVGVRASSSVNHVP